MAPFNGISREREAVRRELRQRGLHAFVHWNTILVLPPLIITEEEWEEGFSAIDRALSAVG